MAVNRFLSSRVVRVGSALLASSVIVMSVGQSSPVPARDLTASIDTAAAAMEESPAAVTTPDGVDTLTKRAAEGDELDPASPTDPDATEQEKPDDGSSGVGSSDLGSSNKGTSDASCVGAETATFGAVVRAVFDSFMPYLPPAQRAEAEAARASVLADLQSMEISTLAVSTHPRGLGASESAPMNTHRDPISQWLVTQLMNVKEGRYAQPITLDNLTISQAVETAWLYFYLTVLIPSSVLNDIAPVLLAAGPASSITLITMPLSLGAQGMSLLYSKISDAIIGRCLVKMTPDEISRAGKPDPDLQFSTEVPTIIQSIADQLAIAEPSTCPSVSDLSLGRIVSLTSKLLQADAPDEKTANRIAAVTRGLERFLGATRVPEGADPGPSELEKIIDIGLENGSSDNPELAQILGIAKLLGRGVGLAQTITLADVTVASAKLAADIAAQVITFVLTAIDDATVSPLFSSALGIELLPHVGGFLTTYGLNVLLNLMSSLCLEIERS
ncbi:hypothetical protein JVX90_17775 [Gordonia sp. PDNC005]|uniref:hypothetical protein n=1 Tax=unclassified Gordonia (in: high G+C Gram-positive bacteria) TaxID=2657482 RepID=UPI001965FA1D|nr:hypothetical protein [Gordonia sp. PDNC005]QRY62211.1 hypothetical protein JVX90_17775 [Gordonia sp. PDNC005]